MRERSFEGLFDNSEIFFLIPTTNFLICIEAKFCIKI